MMQLWGLAHCFLVLFLCFLISMLVSCLGFVFWLCFLFAFRATLLRPGVFYLAGEPLPSHQCRLEGRIFGISSMPASRDELGHSFEVNPVGEFDTGSNLEGHTLAEPTIIRDNVLLWWTPLFGIQEKLAGAQ